MRERDSGRGLWDRQEGSILDMIRKTFLIKIKANSMKGRESDYKPDKTNSSKRQRRNYSTLVGSAVSISIFKTMSIVCADRQFRNACSEEGRLATEIADESSDSEDSVSR